MNEKPRAGNFHWSNEAVETLRTLWRDGLSASQIARELGGDVTRSAVIGKVHRLGLEGRASPSWQSTNRKRRQPAIVKTPSPQPRATATAPTPSAGHMPGNDTLPKAMRIFLATNSMNITQKEMAKTEHPFQVSQGCNPISNLLCSYGEMAAFYMCGTAPGDGAVVAHAFNQHGLTEWTLYIQTAEEPQKERWDTASFTYQATKLTGDGSAPYWLIEATPVRDEETLRNMPMPEKLLAEFRGGLAVTPVETWPVPPCYLNTQTGLAFPVRGIVPKEENCDALPEALLKTSALPVLGISQAVDAEGLEKIIAFKRGDPIQQRPVRSKRPNANSEYNLG